MRYDDEVSLDSIGLFVAASAKETSTKLPPFVPAGTKVVYLPPLGRPPAPALPEAAALAAAEGVAAAALGAALVAAEGLALAAVLAAALAAGAALAAVLAAADAAADGAALAAVLAAGVAVALAPQAARIPAIAAVLTPAPVSRRKSRRFRPLRSQAFASALRSCWC
jgi:hypothetical protein